MDHCFLVGQNVEQKVQIGSLTLLGNGQVSLYSSSPAPLPHIAKCLSEHLV